MTTATITAENLASLIATATEAAAKAQDAAKEAAEWAAIAQAAAARVAEAMGAKPAPAPAKKVKAKPAATPAPTVSFADAFRAAWDQLDRRNGRTNFVRLIEMRAALSQFDRETFDAGLQELRAAWEFSLDSHEGLHVHITPEERAAGITEMGSLLIYVCKR